GRLAGHGKPQDGTRRVARRRQSVVCSRMERSEIRVLLLTSPEAPHSASLHAGYEEAVMSKLGIVGVGAVGCACALSAVTRGSAREIVLVDRTAKRAEAVATDLRYGTPFTPRISVRNGDYGELADAGVGMITAGGNEEAGGRTDPSDP